MNLWALSSTLGFLMQKCLNRFFHVKAVVAAFNQEKALVGAFSVIMNLRMDLRFKLYSPPQLFPTRSGLEMETDS